MAAASVAAPALTGTAAHAAPQAQRIPLRLSLPAPTGPYRVGVTDLHLVDHSRPDPYMTGQPYRELMVSVTYPADDIRGHERSGWLTPGLAAVAGERYDPLVDERPGLVDWAGARTHAYTNAPVKTVEGGWPILVRPLEHWGSASHIRIAMAEMASRGYIVVASEPTFETPVLFPGGRSVPADPAANPPTDFPDLVQFVREKVYGSRVADARFVLDQLQSLQNGKNADISGQVLPRGLRRALDLQRVGVFSGGWSTGLMSLQLLHDDPRIDAAFVGDTVVSVQDENSDLRLPWLPAVRVDRPTFVMGPTLVGADPMWDSQWQNLHGWRRETELVDAGQFSFLDFQSLLPQIQVGLGQPAEKYSAFIGTIAPGESLRTQHTYLAAFFDKFLRGRDNRLLDGPSKRFPAVRFTRR
ncbi:hypothetical protein [Actinoplanes sp. L3-i22]|uniref:hypothetical protein n=1 Tax=Actinoplanes sp. L3-i22 TaxID=2836373 RepID=UPI001C78D715|nr:hypothetical protein [Actinoplanes sp. L3-i22]BCY09544.1 lipase [Actinoplanes sp. L3-i22]